MRSARFLLHKFIVSLRVSSYLLRFNKNLLHRLDDPLLHER